MRCLSTTCTTQGVAMPDACAPLFAVQPPSQETTEGGMVEVFGDAARRVPAETLRPTKLFIGGITRRTTTKSLREHFAKYGRVLDCVAMRQPDGRPRGFGYVTLDSTLGAFQCLSEPQIVDGRIIDLKLAVPEGAADGYGTVGGYGMAPFADSSAPTSDAMWGWPGNTSSSPTWSWDEVASGQAMLSTAAPPPAGPQPSLERSNNRKELSACAPTFLPSSTESSVETGKAQGAIAKKSHILAVATPMCRGARTRARGDASRPCEELADLAQVQLQCSDDADNSPWKIVVGGSDCTSPSSSFSGSTTHGDDNSSLVSSPEAVVSPGSLQNRSMDASAREVPRPSAKLPKDVNVDDAASAFLQLPSPLLLPQVIESNKTQGPPGLQNLLDVASAHSHTGPVPSGHMTILSTLPSPAFCAATHLPIHAQLAEDKGRLCQDVWTREDILRHRVNADEACVYSIELQSVNSLALP